MSGNGKRGELGGRRRALAPPDRPAVDETAHDLLEEERVALRAGDDPIDDGVRQPALRHQPADQADGVGLDQWFEDDLERIAGTATPAGRRGAQLRTGQAEHEQRTVHVLDDVLEQVEQPGIGPMQVLDDGHDRSLGRASLEPGPPRAMDLVAGLARRQRGQRLARILEADGMREGGAHARALDARSGRQQAVDDGADAIEGAGRRIAVEDARRGLQDLAERAVHAGFARGPAAPAQHLGERIRPYRRGPRTPRPGGSCPLPVRRRS